MHRNQRSKPRPGRWAGALHRWRWLVVGAWLAAVVASLPSVGQLGDHLTAGGFEVPGSQSEQVAQLKRTSLSQQAERTNIAVLHSDSLTVDDPAYRHALTAARAALSGAAGVGGVSDALSTPGAISESRDTAIMTVRIDEPQDAAYDHAPQLEQALDRALAGTGVSGDLAGDAPFYAAFQTTAAEDLAKAERAIFPISALILVVALGSVVAGILPLLLAGLSLVVSLALVSVLAEQITVNIFTQNIATMIGLGVGIDYTLFIIKPYRAALQKGIAPREALAETFSLSARGVLVSAMTVVLALSGTVLVDVPAYRSMGFGALIAVGVAAAAAVTLLPALLAILGPRVNLGRVRRTGRQGQRRSRFVTASIRRPWISGLCAMAALGLLAIPSAQMRLGTSGPDILPADSPPRVAAQRLATAFGAGQASPLEVVVTSTLPIGSPAWQALLIKVEADLSASPEVLLVRPPQQQSSGIQTTALLTVVTRHGPQSSEVIALVETTRDRLERLVAGDGTVRVGGEPAQNVDLNNQVGGSVPLVIGWVLVLSFLLLLVAFRSILIAFKAVATNLLSVLATYGILVLVFQEGYGDQWLSVGAPGFIEVFLPLFLFCILFGLSMDYEVFLLTEVRKERLAGLSCRAATLRAVEATAGVITTAAAIMITVFGGFALTSLIPIQAIGFGLAAAVFLDATVVRLMLVPAVLVLLGERNWWLPRWLDALLPSDSRSPRSAAAPSPVARRRRTRAVQPAMVTSQSE